MNFTPKRSKASVNPELIALQEAYPHDLQLYKVPPIGEIPLVEFQDLGLERQKVLQLLEAALAQQHKTLEELKNAFTCSLKKEGLFHYSKLVNAPGCAKHTEQELEARRRDHTSHYILRLAYSLKDDLQNYMITHETELFKLRFNSLNKEGLSQFLATSGIHYSTITKEFREAYREDLFASTVRDADFENIEFYELPFDEVVELVSERKVFVHKGIAYVPQHDLISVFLTHFRNNLATELNKTKKFVLSNLNDDRLQTFVQSLPQCFEGMGKVVWESENTPISKLNDLSKTSYPLCMRIMHDHLMTNHHLKNTGRLQYGLFLKGIGVTLEDSIEFWKTEFTKRPEVNEDKFNKEYLYQVRYNYGKLGRRVDYKPPGCTKLINDAVGTGDVHGCPYKHMDSDELKKKLNEYKLSPAEIAEIARQAGDGQYLLACTKFFECTHKQMPENLFQHPNHYFNLSRKILNKDHVKEEVVEVDTSYAPLSPEKISQPIKVKAENNLNTSNVATPSRTIEKKVRTMERKVMDPKNIEAMLIDDSD